ncbi:MAG: class I SAM-dependent methyltransferase [Myxococcales bacterium FL481]|nr:MAG: class I SAM-dependent methyltransferase [Myxococcales bacterium FL481]
MLETPSVRPSPSSRRDAATGSADCEAGRTAEPLKLAIPPPSEAADQDREWCVVATDAGWKQVRFHDYAAIYEIPGLYERLFCDVLHCDSPRTVVRELANSAGGSLSGYRVLELGAGNGMVGEQLRAHGARDICGLDILPQARAAAERDRPGTYADYVVGDLTRPTPALRQRVLERQFDALVCVAALGFGDIPPQAFRAAFGTVRNGGLVAFNIRDKFLTAGEHSGFSRLVDELQHDGRLEIVRRHEYVHRRATTGAPLNYVAVIAKKQSNGVNRRARN